jgi:hypothetical protein
MHRLHSQIGRVKGQIKSGVMICAYTPYSALRPG